VFHLPKAEGKNAKVGVVAATCSRVQPSRF